MKLLFAIACLLFLYGSGSAQTEMVEQIKIVSGWLGLSERRQDELLIVRKAGRYYAKGREVSTSAIAEFIAAVKSTAIPRPNMHNLGLTREWLSANAEPGIREYASLYYTLAAQNQKELYLTSFQSPAFIESLLPSFFSISRTDDYPGVEIEIVKTGGQRIKVSSQEQSLFMLPWTIDGDNSGVKTYNADIARRLAKLLPKKFTNRERLAGEELRRALAEVVMRAIKNKWELLDVENKAGPDLDEIRKIFTVEEAEINPYHNVDYGEKWTRGGATQSNLHVILTRGKFPENYTIGLVLPYKAGKVEGLNAFLSGVEKYESRVLAVPWLKRHLAANPKIAVQLRYVTDRSFSENAMKVFAEDMRLGGKEDLAKEVAAAQKEVSLLLVGSKYYETYWLVLPDKRMALWRFKVADLLRKVVVADTRRWACSDYQGECVGAIVSAEGELIP